MKRIRKISALLLAALLMLSTVPAVCADDGGQDAVILFTHDLHSHFLPAADESGSSYGGYARLKTRVDQQKALHPDAVYLDAGDFSAGSLFQVSFRTSAAELRVMGALGVDVTTFGNHEYDYGPAGLADMLNAAADSGDPLPAIVETNFLPPSGEASVRAAFARCGVTPYALLERGGIRYAVVSAFGENSEEYSPTAGMEFTPPAGPVQQAVDAARQECLTRYGEEPIVVCISHCGTENGGGEDVELAKKVKGLHLIVSGHSHTTLQAPLRVNGTYVVSAGEYAKNLGVVTLHRSSDGTVSLADYALLPVNDTVKEDEAMTRLIERYKAEVERDYLSLFGMRFDEVLIRNGIALESVDQVYATQHESNLCSVFSDAYKWAAEEVSGEPVDVALTAAGVIRETLPRGDVTVADVFTAASLGDGASGVPGGALLSIWLTGRDLRNVLEVDASVQPIMPAAQLFCSGVRYSINRDRMIFNRVVSASLCRPDGTAEPIADDQLYRVVTGTYAGNMLGTVKDKSFALLSVTPRDRNGDPIDAEHLTDHIILNEDGSELKEWYAIARYLQSMGQELDGKYAAPDGRKTVYRSLAPADLLQNANRFTYIAMAVLLLLAAGAVLAVRGIVRRIRRKKAKKI